MKPDRTEVLLGLYVLAMIAIMVSIAIRAYT